MTSNYRIQPFRALHFDPSRTATLDRVVAPPYDLVDQKRQSELYDRNPYNVIRLELNRASDPYVNAAATLEQWSKDGILVRSAKPAIYLYTQRFQHEGRAFVRTGLIARVKLEEFATGRILPHEKTFPKAKEDRLRLLEATRTNISSIFGLYPVKDAALSSLLDAVGKREPTLSATDDLGIANEIRAIDNSDEVAVIQRVLEAPRILIADGHHRYETSLNYRRQQVQAGNSSADAPCNYTMMTIVAFDDPGLVVLPTHRVVRELPEAARASFGVKSQQDFVSQEFSDKDQMLAALKAAGQGSLGVVLKNDRFFRLMRLRSPASLAAAMPETPDSVRGLDVSILHTLIFDRIFGIKADEVRKGGNIEYTIDAHGAVEQVLEGNADGAFLMNAPTIDDIDRVSGAGATMPEKSTYFFPKLITGLIMNPLED
ncbi:MAG TPA: DUF1015 domain-containing protein [Candidatus Binataceae bacterium]|nr:DUF1015 domain-containing protein [Candidatus Binataceae bacterium]